MTLMSGWRRKLLIWALLLLALVPVTAVRIPRFVLFDALELVGTYVPPRTNPRITNRASPRGGLGKFNSLRKREAP
jgi:hypothetical protein